ncbi:hypothetical protein [Sinobaca sp. H24]|uniref:hypothetical protein n=1 Tax=Sinobaca sp. H24 TaxID=2923376 RepID=UPI00207ABC12|nr:hypothetical protein [Sinobaca sp. H24]
MDNPKDRYEKIFTNVKHRLAVEQQLKKANDMINSPTYTMLKKQKKAYDDISNNPGLAMIEKRKKAYDDISNSPALAMIQREENFRSLIKNSSGYFINRQIIDLQKTLNNPAFIMIQQHNNIFKQIKNTKLESNEIYINHIKKVFNNSVLSMMAKQQNNAKNILTHPNFYTIRAYQNQMKEIFNDDSLRIVEKISSHSTSKSEYSNYSPESLIDDFNSLYEEIEDIEKNGMKEEWDEEVIENIFRIKQNIEFIHLLNRIINVVSNKDIIMSVLTVISSLITITTVFLPEEPPVEKTEIIQEIHIHMYPTNYKTTEIGNYNLKSNNSFDNQIQKKQFEEFIKQK